MTNLIDRIEALDGPDREVDAQIACAVRWEAPEPMGGCKAILKMHNHIAGPVEAGCYWLVQRSGQSLKTAPDFTASEKSAMKLLDGADFREFMKRIKIKKRGANYAIAICAAALKARMGVG